MQSSAIECNRVLSIRLSSPPIMLGEVDWPDMCRCPACRALDMPPPTPLPHFLVSQTDSGLPGSEERQRGRGHVLAGFYKPLCTSDRYANFWLNVQQLAAKRNPEALITTYIYYSYFPAPTSGIKLNRHIFGEFVPWGNPQHTDFFPMAPEALAYIKEQWDGWQKSGIRLSYRPNYMHDGWIMPLVETTQSLDFFQYAANNGMEGTRYDSLTGQWAAQGPKLYGHLRLFARPDLSIESILTEYYEAFGAAEPEIRAYFAYWENYCRENYQHFNDLFIDYGHRWARFQLLAHKAFPPSCFPPAEELLHKAAQTAQHANQPQAAARVQFLRDGLTHASLGIKLATAFDGARELTKELPQYRSAITALRDLIAFRRAHEKPYISDYLYGAAWREQRFWNLKPLLAEPLVKAVVGGNENRQSEDTKFVP